MAKQQRPGQGKNTEGKGGNPRPGQTLFSDWIPCKTEPDGRIRLPKRIKMLLEENSIEQLWVGFKPKQRVLVFCPPGFWNDWLEGMRKTADEETWNEIECLGMAQPREVGWDNHGRIKPKLREQDYIGIEEADGVIFQGCGKWIEVFSEARLRRLYGR
jgi:DNA-binding transcriptional regulator/RsmH inhibitor MraZ